MLGIVACSGMLLLSVTLVQRAEMLPPVNAQSFASAAVEVADSDEPSQMESEGTESAAAVEATAVVPPTRTPQADSPALNEPPPTAINDQLSVAGTGIIPPDLGLRFNKATPVRMAPVLLQIPEAWVDARIQPVGVTPTGEMETPDDFWEVGWYRYGARPGDVGRAVIAGHLDSHDGAAVFYHIGDLEPGDEIRVLLGGPDGERFFTVREVAVYPADDAPVDEIFGPSDHPELVLITCGGDWRGRDAGGYSDRIVVYADMVQPATAHSQ